MVCALLGRFDVQVYGSRALQVMALRFRWGICDYFGIVLLHRYHENGSRLLLGSDASQGDGVSGSLRK